jgi:hypothetical protein
LRSFLASLERRALEYAWCEWPFFGRDPDKVPGTDRAKENIVFLRHVWLDFENGDLPPDQVPDLFPHFRMIITNTFQHTGEKPRFRVVIPTAQIMTPEVYSILYDSIGYKLEDAGYQVDRDKRSKARNEGKRKSGLDWSKATPTSLFYLPCQAEDPSQSFFKVYTGSGRLTMDPRTWVENSGYLIKAEAEEEAASSKDDQEVGERGVAGVDGLSRRRRLPLLHLGPKAEVRRDGSLPD